MSLYDGMEMDDNEGKKDKPDVSGWGSRSKLLETQKQLQAKKISLLNIKKQKNMTVPPVFDLKRRGEDVPLTFNMLTGRMERMGGSPVVAPMPAVPVPAAPFLGSDAPAGSGFIGLTEEYDPLRPNDYETYVKRRKEQRHKEREEERKKEQEERERRRRERHRERGDFDEENDRNNDRNNDRTPQRSSYGEDRTPVRGNHSDEEDSDGEERRRRRRRRDDDEDREDNRDRDRGRDRDRDAHRSGGAAIAPPMSLIEDSKPNNSDAQNISGEYGAGFNVGKGSVVSRMMAKMGYREGSGLGKSEQGMSTALQVEKTSKRGGKIIHERDIPKDPPRQEINARSNANLLKNPTKVILLRNMVGPGEVDEDLEPETAEECAKYGKVIKCVIYEIPTNEDEEAIRIFLEFERQEAAIKAIVDLNGRYFGGRMVKATFYNLDKFRRLDLASPVE